MWQKAKNIYHLLRAFIACQIYQNPAKNLTVIGITGTDGKTTTANMLYHVLTSAGKKTSIVSTISAIINDKEYDTGFHVSTPDGMSLQKYLRKAVDSGTEYMILEVTSHGLDQNRSYGIDFAIGVITNITHEHLDYHKTYTEYIKAKVKLLKNSRLVIINRDDGSYDYILRYKSKMSEKKWISYGLSKKADINPDSFPFELDIPGEFNKYNALAVISAARELGIPTTEITKSLKTFKLPKGRFDIVYDGKFEIVIDFAHTPNGLTQLLSSQVKNHGRIIHIFGAAGERDASKRPMMGEASAKYSDIMILTAEDPRSEKVKDICEEIASGTLTVKDFNKENLFIIPDRQKAIDKGIEIAKDNDLVLITGKGHEVSMNMGHGEEAWSDYEAVKKALTKVKL